MPQKAQRRTKNELAFFRPVSTWPLQVYFHNAQRTKPFADVHRWLRNTEPRIEMLHSVGTGHTAKSVYALSSSSTALPYQIGQHPGTGQALTTRHEHLAADRLSENPWSLLSYCDRGIPSRGFPVDVSGPFWVAHKKGLAPEKGQGKHAGKAPSHFQYRSSRRKMDIKKALCTRGRAHKKTSPRESEVSSETKQHDTPNT